jgi:hypothetical protein
MAPLASRLRRYLRDSLVIRVCVFIYGALFFGLGFAIAYAFFMPPESFEWITLGLAIAGFGAFMLYASVFGRLRILEKAANAVSDGGEILGIVLMLAVFLAALPIAAIVKLARSARKHL